MFTSRTVCKNVIINTALLHVGLYMTRVHVRHFSDEARDKAYFIKDEKLTATLIIAGVSLTLFAVITMCCCYWRRKRRI